MITIFIRTVVIYLILVVTIRLLGKRHIGELEPSELVTTLLLSEIAALPITEPDIPVAFAVIPIITLLCLEVFSSVILLNFPSLKRLISARPSVIIDRGKLIQSELKRQRLTIDEFICELRRAGVVDISEVYCAIVEEDGGLTVVPKSRYRQPTLDDMHIRKDESGFMHIIISDGHIDAHGLKTVFRDRDWLDAELSSRRIGIKDVFLMLADDSGNISIIEKENRL